MDDELQLADLLDSRISVFDPDFQKKLNRKKEYLELEPDGTEKIEKGSFKPQKHQKFTYRYLMDYDRLIDISDTGTGKSGGMSYFFEKIRREFEKAKADPNSANPKISHYKRFVIVAGKKVAESFRSQLVNKVSDGRYLENAKKLALEIIEKDPTKNYNYEKILKGRITDQLKKAGYIIEHYEKFGLELKENYLIKEESSQEDIIMATKKMIDDYSDTIFWIDEYQNLNVEPDKINSYKTKVPVYKAIWNLFHIALRSKVILSSASPMLNNVEELAFGLNLILPRDRVLPSDFDYKNASNRDITTFFPGLDPITARLMTPEEISPYFRGQIYISGIKTNKNPKLPQIVKNHQNQFEYEEGYGSNTDGNDDLRKPLSIENATYNDLEPYFRGRIFYTKKEKSRAVPVDQGIVMEMRSQKDRTYMSAMVTNMSEVQEEGYMKYINYINDGVVNDSVYTSERQAANIIYPDGTINYKNYIKFEKNDFKATSEFKFAITENIRPTSKENIDKIISNIGEYSCINMSIIKSITQLRGVHYIYNPYVGTGQITTAVFLEMIGYKKFDEKKSVFEPDPKNPDKRKIIISKEKRYVIINGGKTSIKNIGVMTELIVSEENVFGEYVGVIITSGAAKEGINIYNVIAEHLSPEWNGGSNYQAESRGIRVDSHDKLLEISQNIIDDILNILSRKKIEQDSNLYQEARALVISQSGGIILPKNIKVDDLITQLEISIKTTKNQDQIPRALDMIKILKENKIENIDKNIEMITVIFYDRKELYEDFLKNLHDLDDDEYLKKSIEIVIENIQYLIKQLTMRTIDLNVVDDYENLKSKLVLLHDNLKVKSNDCLDNLKSYLEIKIFKYIAQPYNAMVVNADMRAKGILNPDNKLLPIATRIYKMAESKQHVIKEKFEMMVRASIGHDIFYNKNNDIKSGKSNIDINVEDIDYNGYDLFYSDEIISGIKNDIIEIFHENNYFTLYELSTILIDYQIKFNINSLTLLRKLHIPFIDKNNQYISDDMVNKIKQLNPSHRINRFINLLNQLIKNKVNINEFKLSADKIKPLVERYRDNFIITALENLISNKIPIFDKYGFTVYIRENNGYFYVDRNYPIGVSSNSCMMYYSDNIITIKNKNLEEILNINESINIYKSLDKIKEINDLENLNKYLDSLTVRIQANILENIIMEVLTINNNYFIGDNNKLSKDKKYIEEIISKYKYYIIYLHEPYSEIKKSQSIGLKEGPKRGRPPGKNNSLYKSKKIDTNNIKENTDTEIVYLHTLYSKDIDISKYGQVARIIKGEGRKRILKISEINKGWRDVKSFEDPVYSKYIEINLKSKENDIIVKTKEITGEKLYGLVNNGEFLIVDKERETNKAKTDGRSKVPGRVAITFSKHYLIDVLWRIKVYPPNKDAKGFFVKITEKDRENYISGLVGKTLIYYHGSKNLVKLGPNDILYYTFDEMMKWEIDRLNFYYRWIKGYQFDRALMAELIYNRMDELGIVDYK